MGTLKRYGIYKNVLSTHGKYQNVIQTISQSLVLGKKKLYEILENYGNHILIEWKKDMKTLILSNRENMLVNFLTV